MADPGYVALTGVSFGIGEALALDADLTPLVSDGLTLKLFR